MAKLQGLSDISLLTKELHVWPDFHGNRSPLADPTMKGMVTGLTINCSEENLALLYLATLQGLSVSRITQKMKIDYLKLLYQYRDKIY